MSTGRNCQAPDASPRDLAANGREVFDWRMMDGTRRLVAVAINFTILSDRGEPYPAFRERVLRYVERLGDLRFPVTRLAVVRREELGKLAYADFECATPEAALPRPAVEQELAHPG